MPTEQEKDGNGTQSPIKVIEEAPFTSDPQPVSPQVPAPRRRRRRPVLPQLGLRLCTRHQRQRQRGLQRRHDGRLRVRDGQQQRVSVPPPRRLSDLPEDASFPVEAPPTPRPAGR